MAHEALGMALNSRSCLAMQGAQAGRTIRRTGCRVSVPAWIERLGWLGGLEGIAYELVSQSRLGLSAGDNTVDLWLSVIGTLIATCTSTASGPFETTIHPVQTSRQVLEVTIVVAGGYFRIGVMLIWYILGHYSSAVTH